MKELDCASRKISPLFTQRNGTSNNVHAPFNNKYSLGSPDKEHQVGLRASFRLQTLPDMAQRWTRPFPVLQLSRQLMNLVQVLVQPASSLIGKCFKNYIFMQFAIVALYSCIKLSFTATQRMDMLKVVLEAMVSIYGFGIAIVYKRSNIFRLVGTLRNGLSVYSSYLVTPAEKKKLGLNDIDQTTLIAESVIAFTIVKGIYDFIVVPFTTLRQEFNTSSTKSIIAHVTGLPNDASFSIYLVCFVLFFTPNIALVGIFNSVWQITLVNAIALLEGELKILAESLENVKQRSKEMFDGLKVDMMNSRWSKSIRPTGRTRRRCRPRANMLSEDEDLKLKEQCLFECLHESALHQQSIYRFIFICY